MAQAITLGSYRSTPAFMELNIHKRGRKLVDFINIFDRGNPAITGVVPRGYVTLEEFGKVAMEQTKEFCKEYGIR